MGYEQIIRPGQVNLMTAGCGIAHAEDSVTEDAGRLHAAQLWIALPEAERQRPPNFQHYPDLPVLEADGFRVTVLAGTVNGQTAPTEVFSPLVGLDITALRAAQTTVSLNPGFEHATLVLSGEVEVAGERLTPGTLLYLGCSRERIPLRCGAPARLMLIGGEPFKEEILLWWNFVARTQEEMRQSDRGLERGALLRRSQRQPLATPGRPGSCWSEPEGSAQMNPIANTGRPLVLRGGLE